MVIRHRILILVLTVVVALGVAAVAAAGWLFLRGQPGWYVQASSTPAPAGAARRMEASLIHLYNRMGALHAYHVRQQQTRSAHVSLTTSTSVAPGAEQPFDITFSDAELNAFFEKWIDADGRRSAMQAVVDTPRLQVRSGGLILAGRVKQFHTVISIDLMPRVDADGQLQMNLRRVYGGILPLPEVVWAGERARIVQMMDQKYQAVQPDVEIAPDGTANASAAVAGFNRLLVAALQHQPVQPVLFLPYDVRRLNRTVPTQVQSIMLADGTVTLRVREMNASERALLLASMRGTPRGLAGTAP